MSKGSAPRPVHNKTYGENFDRIFRKPPKDCMTTKDCSHPFCDCKDKCKEVEKNANT